VTGGVAPASGLDLTQRLEAHSVYGWPPQVVEETEDGWVLRAAPGLERGRSNHALTPCRQLSRAEIESGLARVAAFADREGIECGLQVSPLEIHIPLLEEVAIRGWEIQTAVQVLVASRQSVAGADGEPVLPLVSSDSVDDDWLAAWSLCEPERAARGSGWDAETHARTVFPSMTGLARFARHEDLAVGISVEHDNIVGLFCLAVAPHARRQGIGKALVRAMLSGSSASIVYLQVFSENVPGLALYESLGFQEAYRYCHCIAPSSAG
jgi:N-acetylglutamate synthase